MHSGVHPLGRRRGCEHGPRLLLCTRDLPVIPYLALIDSEGGQPDWIGDPRLAGRAPVHNGLHLVGRRVGRLRTLRTADIGNDSEPSRRGWKKYEHSVRVPLDAKLSRTQ